MRKHYCSLIALSCLLVGCGSEHPSVPSEGPKPSADARPLEEPTLRVTPTDNFTMAPEQEEIYHFLVAELANDRGDQVTSVHEYIDLAKETHDPVIAARATSIALQSGQFEDALISGKMWADLTPHDQQTQAIAVGIALKTKHPEQGLPYLEHIMVKDDEKTLETLSFIRSTLENKQDQMNFVKLMKDYGEQHKDFRALFMAAGVAGMMDDSEQAMALANQVTELNPGWMRGAALRIQLLYETGQVDKAKQYLAELNSIHPNNTSLKWLQAQMYIETGETAQGARALEGLLHDPKYGADATLELSRISIKNGDLTGAQTRLLGFLKTHPDNDEAYYLSAYIYQQDKNMLSAVTQYSKINHGPYYVNANLQMALISARQGDHDKALAILEPLFTQYPEEGARLELAKTQILLDSNHIQEAYTQLNHILIQNNDNTELRYIHGLIGAELGHKDEAERDFRFVISKEPNHLDAINDLAGILLDQGKYKEAQSYVEQAIALAPNDPQALGHLGWLRYQQGNSTEALKYLQEAQALSQDPEIATYYGSILWAKGSQKEAIAVWKQALASNPENTRLIKTMKDHAVDVKE